MEIYKRQLQENSNNIIYTAVFFNTNEVVSKYKQVHPNLYSHHSTIQFKPTDISDLPIGEEINIKVIGRLTNDKVDVLVVKNPLSKNKFPHITLSTAEGIKPFQSNTEIENNQDKIKPINDNLIGIVGYFDGSEKTKLEEMEVSKKDLENQKLISQAHKDITRTKGKDYAPDVHDIQNWINNPKKLREDAEDANFIDEITKGELEEAKKKKGDRCTRIAKSKYDVWPSAYACVPESSSKALTRDGWKTVDELNIGEEILTYNINTDKLEFKPILNLHRYKNAKTNVVRSGNNGFVFEATDNHKWVVKLPETKGKRAEKYERINDKALIETKELLLNKNNKHLVVTAPYDGGEKIKKDKIYKYGDNWVKYILDISDEQRQTWLFSAIVYDGNQQKIERLTENKEEINDLDWKYTSTNDKQSFGFKQKDIEHRDAFLLSAFLNNGLVTWKKHKTKNIYSCHYTSNKRFKNTSNFKLVKENNTDVWCPETENGTWVMMQETEGSGIITTTGNSGAVVKCRQGKIWKGLKEEEENNIDKRKIYVLVGPPSVGKSTWIKNTFADIQPYVISRDNIVEQIADNLGWTYDDLFVAPPQGSQLGDYDEKYGEVIKSPSYMSWQPLSFSKVLEANNQVHLSFTKLVSNAVNSEKDIVVDMTNMTSGARKNALKAIEGNESLFEKIAVVFPFEGAEDVIIDVARKRAEAAKRMGKSKTLPDSVMRKMFASFQNVTPDEGFDKVIQQDNRELLSTLNEKWSEKYKKSIDCNNPKGFSQKAHCKGRLKEEDEYGMSGVEQLENKLLDKYEGLKTLFLSASKGVLYIDMIEVNPNERNKNIGSNVINDIIEYADANNMEIRLNPAVKDKRTGTTSRNRLVKFYKNFGFIENTGRNIDYTKKSGTMYRLPKSGSVNDDSLNEKTDFSKEKKQGLHGWFARQGGKGKSKGWVDCNTCRDGKCKSCGRKEGESRSKYPACRPTPSACKTKGRGDSWGKKSKNEDVLNEQTKQDIEKELKLNEIKSLFQRHIGKL